MEILKHSEQTVSLPPDGDQWRYIAIAILVLFPSLFGLLTLWLGQDISWDLRNYHLYNPYAFLSGRQNIDLMPGSFQSYFNPLLDIPFYLLSSHLPPRTAFFIIGAVQGLNGTLLFLLSFTMLRLRRTDLRVATAAVLSLLGVLSGMGIAVIGTLFYDNVISLGILGSMLILARAEQQMMCGPIDKRLRRAIFFCGLLIGLMAGLKLTAATFAIGVCFAVFWMALRTNDLKRLVVICGLLGGGAITGFLATYGFWAVHLYGLFGNPFFPFFNKGVFYSPLLPPTSTIADFKPQGIMQYLFFPFFFAVNPRLVNEIDWRDLRLPILYALLLLAAALSAFRRPSNNNTALMRPIMGGGLLVMIVASYLLWLSAFCVYRYIVLLDMLAPLAIVTALQYLPFKRAAWQTASAAILLGIITLSIQPGNWGRRETWSDRMVKTTPALPDMANAMLLLSGQGSYAHLATLLPPNVPMVRIQSRLFDASLHDGRTNWPMFDKIKKRLASHSGPFYLLYQDSENSRRGLKETLEFYHLKNESGCIPISDDVYAVAYIFCPLTR